MEVGWGSQIRSYVLAPYQLIRDERTKMVDGKEQPICETANVDSFMVKLATFFLHFFSGDDQRSYRSKR